MFSALYDNFINFFKLGGPVIFILVGISILAITLMLMKFWQFIACKAGQSKVIDEAMALWLQGHLDRAINMLTPLKSASSQSIAMAMNMRKEGGYTRDDIENTVILVAKQYLHNLQRHLKTLDAITQIAPLLGLFGTVLGMIKAFQTLQEAGSAVDPSQLAGGIWVALLTTAGGLVIAIPVSAFVTWLEGRIENEQLLIEINVEMLIVQPRPIRESEDISATDSL